MKTLNEISFKIYYLGLVRERQVVGLPTGKKYFFDLEPPCGVKLLKHEIVNFRSASSIQLHRSDITPLL